jgi:hypothetical protein
MAVIVDGRRAGKRNRLADRNGNHRIRGHQELGDAPVVAVFLGVAARANGQSVLRRQNEEARCAIARHVVRQSAAQILDPRRSRRGAFAMQERDVARIDFTLDVLQEVARLNAFADVAVALGHMGPLELG